jgi:pimeloyl-ACP methyl ester carboxylesterase
MPSRRIRTASSADGLLSGEPTTSDAATSDVPVRDFFYTSEDGLTLFARDYGDPLSPWLPVVCLTGLTRSHRDFQFLAAHLAGHRHRPRRVVAIDYRGRGRSQWAKDAATYNPLTEMGDVFSAMAALGIPRAVVTGTSRGGIIGMLMALNRPAAVAGLVLNDVGPLLEARGLARIKAYVGRTPFPDDWADAAHIQRRLHGGQFTAWDDDDWNLFARLTYREENGRPVSDYDPAIATALDGIELDRPVPDLWNEFRALKSTPVMSIRGQNSDLLSAETVARMKAEHADLDVVTIQGVGHPPLLRGGQLLGRISAFVTAIEGQGPPTEAIVPREAPVFDLDARDD